MVNEEDDGSQNYGGAAALPYAIKSVAWDIRIKYMKRFNLNDFFFLILFLNETLTIQYSWAIIWVENEMKFELFYFFFMNHHHGGCQADRQIKIRRADADKEQTPNILKSFLFVLLFCLLLSMVCVHSNLCPSFLRYFYTNFPQWFIHRGQHNPVMN